MPTPKKIDPTGKFGGVLLINFRASVDMVAGLKQIATRKKMTLSNYLREICWEALKKETHNGQ